MQPKGARCVAFAFPLILFKETAHELPNRPWACTTPSKCGEVVTRDSVALPTLSPLSSPPRRDVSHYLSRLTGQKQAGWRRRLPQVKSQGPAGPGRITPVCFPKASAVNLIPLFFGAPRSTRASGCLNSASPSSNNRVGRKARMEEVSQK